MIEWEQRDASRAWALWTTCPRLNPGRSRYRIQAVRIWGMRKAVLSNCQKVWRMLARGHGRLDGCPVTDAAASAGRVVGRKRRDGGMSSDRTLSISTPWRRSLLFVSCHLWLPRPVSRRAAVGVMGKRWVTPDSAFGITRALTLVCVLRRRRRVGLRSDHTALPNRLNPAAYAARLAFIRQQFVLLA
jgi:hypothetical protein